MTDLLCAEYPAEGSDTDARKRSRLGASNWFRLAGRMLPQRFVGKGVELARLYVLLELAVPRRPVKRQKPVPKFREFLSRKSLDLALDSFNLAHECSLAPHRERRPTRAMSGGTAKTFPKALRADQLSHLFVEASVPSARSHSYLVVCLKNSST